jgi:hypothetical protein
MKKLLLFALTVSMLAITNCSKENHDPDEDIFIDIPDETFRNYLLTTSAGYYDRNKDGKISVAEAKNVTWIECYTDNIYTLEGIQYFINLETLRCSGGIAEYADGKLTSLDVSKNTKLTELDCSKNQIESLNLSNNVALEELNCSVNYLNSLDLSKNINLTELNSNHNNTYNGGIVSLDLSNNVKLKSLNCHYTFSLTNLDISKCLSLEYLELADCKLQSLDLSKHTKLLYVGCWMDSLVTLILIQGHHYDYLYYYYGRTNVIYN